MLDMINKLADSRNKVAIVTLNVICGLALLCAATWFSYNVFSTRDAAQTAVQDTQNNARDIQSLEKKVPTRKGQ